MKNLYSKCRHITSSYYIIIPLLDNGKVDKLNDQDLEMIVAEMERDPFQPVSYILASLNLDVKPRALRKALKTRTNLKYRKAAKKVELREPHVVTRMQFANNYEARTEEEWKNTVYVDEKVFSIDKDGRYGVWRPDGTRYDVHYVLQKTHSTRHTRSYWACMDEWAWSWPNY